MRPPTAKAPARRSTCVPGRADARAVRGHGSRLPGLAATDPERVRSGTDGGLGTGPGRARRGTRRAKREERGGYERISESAAPINGESCLFDLYEIPGPSRVGLLPLRDMISRGALSHPSVRYH